MRIEAVTLMLSFNFQLWLGVKPGLKCFHFAEIREQVNIVIVNLIFILIFILIIILISITISTLIIMITTSWRRSEALQRVKFLRRNQRRRRRRDFTLSWSIRRLISFLLIMITI